jgi:hypothetical protein
MMADRLDECICQPGAAGPSSGGSNGSMMGFS